MMVLIPNYMKMKSGVFSVAYIGGPIRGGGHIVQPCFQFSSLV